MIQKSDKKFLLSNSKIKKETNTKPSDDPRLARNIRFVTDKKSSPNNQDKIKIAKTENSYVIIKTKDTASDHEYSRHFKGISSIPFQKDFKAEIVFIGNYSSDVIFSG